jgi:hypothetical protein
MEPKCNCGQPATYKMYAIETEYLIDNPCVPMCAICAWHHFETGLYESDGTYPE